jgi:flap endonuclease-1
MGIKNLNSFLRDNCTESIKCISLADLSGKKIAVDISIYIYKYVSDNSLIENIYLMLATFRYYNIIPIFIFDGKPPAEKKELLQKRRADKKKAENEYNQLKNILESADIAIDTEKKEEIVTSMDSLKKKFVYVNREQIEKVKEMIRAYGLTYYDAPGEADELCALLVAKKKVWACLSEDMDMFVYGCRRVLRYLSLLNHNAVLYDTKNILQELGISLKEFREICILSGTDYNIVNENEHNLMHTLRLFKKYHKSKTSKEFYDWLLENTNYILHRDELDNIYKMFDLSLNQHSTMLKVFDKIKIVNTQIRKDAIHSILEEDGFIFSRN